MALHTSNKSGRTTQMPVQRTERRSRGQGELHRWVYRAQRGIEKARESCTDGCTDHKEALKRPGRVAQMGVQGTERRPRGSKLSPRGVQELQVEPKKRPRSSKLSPRGAQVRPSAAQKRSWKLQVEAKSVQVELKRQSCMARAHKHKNRALV